MRRNYQYSRSSQRKINSTHPMMQEVCARAIQIANTRMLHVPDFGISSGLRTTAQQEAVYAIGRTVDVNKPTVSNVDGVNDISSHQTGKAVDIYCYVNKKTNYDLVNLIAVASCFFQAAAELKVELNWGGNWTHSIDCPHFEIVI